MSVITKKCEATESRIRLYGAKINRYGGFCRPLEELCRNHDGGLSTFTPTEPYFHCVNRLQVVNIDKITYIQNTNQKYEDIARELADLYKNYMHIIRLLSNTGVGLHYLQTMNPSCFDAYNLSTERVNKLINISLLKKKIRDSMALYEDHALTIKKLFVKQNPIHPAISDEWMILVYSLDRAVIHNGRDWFKFNFRACVR